MKRYRLLVLTLLLSAALSIYVPAAVSGQQALPAGLTGGVYAENGAKSGKVADLSWSFDGTTLKITGSGKIPSYKTDGKSSSGGADLPWLSFRGKIRKLSLGDKVTGIGAHAFYGLTALTEVTLGESITEVHEGAFEHCTALKKVVWNAKDTDIPQWCFSGCSSLKDFSGKKFTSFGKKAFYQCTSLETLDLDTYKMDMVGDSCFAGCTSLKKVWFKGDVTEMGSDVFDDTRNVSVYIPGQFWDAYYLIRWEYTNVSWKVSWAATRPLLSYIEPSKEGLTIHWDAVEGAKGYVIYRSGDYGKNWKKLAVKGTKISYTDDTAEVGKTYTYTVRALNGNKEQSGYDPDGLSGLRLASPVITSVKMDAGGVRLQWKAVKNAQNYMIYAYYDGVWETVGATPETSFYYTDAVSGTNYKFAVRCLSADEEDLMSGYVPTAKTYSFVGIPQITRATCGNEGITLSWDKIDTVEAYRVFVWNGKYWDKLADTKKGSFQWKKAKPGRTYRFTIRCVTADGKSYTSGYDDKGRTVQFLKTPSGITLTPTTEGQKVSWDKVEGAEAYRVFRYTGEYWDALADVTGTSWTRTTVESGKRYVYTVRCITADGEEYTSGFNPKGKRGLYLSSPVISSISSEADGAKISWKAVPGAERYHIFYWNGKEWKMIGHTTGTSFTWKDAKSGANYQYTVRCANKDGTAFTSDFTKGRSGTFIAAPQVSLKNTEAGIQVSWKECKGAERYHIFYWNGKEWKMIGHTTGTSFTWKEAKKGATYQITVRCANKDGTRFTSGFTKGKTITRK